MLSGVTVGTEASALWLLHRGGRVWDANTFVKGQEGIVADATPIAAPPVLLLEKDSGKVLK